MWSILAGFKVYRSQSSRIRLTPSTTLMEFYALSTSKVIFKANSLFYFFGPSGYQIMMR